MSTSQYSPPPPTAPPADPYPVDPPSDGPAAPGPRRFRRRGPRSLISKLTLGVVSLVVALVFIISAATYFSFRSFLYDRLDGQLDSIVAANTNTIVQCFKDGSRKCYLRGSPDYKAPQTEWVGVISPPGQPPVDVTQGLSLKLLNLTTAEMAAIRDDPIVSRTVVTRDDQNLRVSAREIRTPVGNYTVISGLSTGEIQRTLGRLVLLEASIGSAAVVLALVATTAGVRFSMRRLRRVTTTAQEVAMELSPEGAGLDRRVPDDEPETEVGQLATSFNTMLAAVETQFQARIESEQRMRQFLADASHELRTPLTSIRGYAELTRMQRAVGDNSDDNLGRIEFEGTRMSRLVEDLLMLARGDGNGDDRPQQRELIEVAGLVDDAVSGSRAAFPAREFLVGSVPDDAYVVGDPDQLLRVVRNLVTNAAVHTAEDRPITVRCLVDDDGVAIQVVDGGPGLSVEDAAHVFERFWRADKARTRVRGGSGLGMSIVASIVRAHGGTVRFDSSVENGSTVTVWLPGVQPG